MGASSSKQKSTTTPVDMTPASFASMQSPFGDVLMQLLGYTPTSTTTTTTGGTAAQTGLNTTNNNNQNSGGQGQGRQRSNNYQTQAVLDAAKSSGWNVLDYRSGSGTGTGTGTGTTNTTTTSGYGVSGDINDILRGIPGYEGKLTADLGANEQAILDMLMGQATTNSTGEMTGDPSTDFLKSIIAGAGLNPETTGYDPGSTLAEWVDELAAASNTGAFGSEDGSGTNPFMQAYIESAQRETMRSLEETLTRSLPGRFTEAGQFVQPGSSSAFDRAAAIATEGAAAAAGDIATDISYQAYASAADREAEAMAQELERRGQYGEAARVREDAAAEAARQRQQDAATELPAIQASQIDSLIKNLEAQGLPRMIEDLGIERGIEQFNTQVENLLTTLGITAGVTRPVISSESSSSGSSSGFQMPGMK